MYEETDTLFQNKQAELGEFRDEQKVKSLKYGMFDATLYHVRFGSRGT
jgi:hypothetical protein